MPIDARIPLGGHIQPVQSPTQMLAGIMQVASAKERLHGERQINAKRTREAADDAAIRAALQNHPNDYDAALEELQRGGHGSAAITLEQHMTKARADRVSQRTNETKMMKAALELQEHFLSGIHDEETFQVAKHIVQQIFPQSQPGQPSPADMMGDHYEQKNIDRLIDSLQAPKDRFQRAHWAAGDLARANDIASRNTRRGVLNDRDKAAQEANMATANTRWKSFAGHALEQASNDTEWQQIRGHLKSEGVPQAIIDTFPPSFSSKALDIAKKAQLTEEQRRRLDREDTDAQSRRIRANKPAAAGDPNDPKHADPWFSRDESAYKLYLSQFKAAHPVQQTFDKNTKSFVRKADQPQSFDEWRKENGHLPQAGAATPPAATPAPAAAPGGQTFTLPGGKTVKIGDQIPLKDGSTATFQGVNPKTGRPIIGPPTPAAATPPPQDENDDAAAPGGDEEDDAASGDDDEPDTAGDDAGDEPEPAEPEIDEEE